MGAGVTKAGDCTAEAAGAGVYVFDGDKTGPDGGNGRDESPWQSLGKSHGTIVQELGLRVTEDRVLIKADQEDHAPTQAESGLYLASSLAAAVEGEDPGESWFVGTIVQLGPRVNQLDHRRIILRWLLELEDHDYDLALAEVRALRARIEGLPAETPDPLTVGDRVAFSWASGQQITVDGEKYLILRASDVLAVLED